MAEVKKETTLPPPVSPTVTPSGAISSLRTKSKPTKWGVARQTVSSFKGAIPELSGKVFVTGPSQATRYDEAYKALLHYFNTKYDHRVHRAFESKDSTIGLALITRPTPPKKKVTVQVPTESDPTIMKDVIKEVIDKDADSFFEYQEELKRYVADKSKYNKDMQGCFKNQPLKDLRMQPTPSV